MEIPKWIKIGGHKVSVEFRDTRDIDNPGSYNDYHQLILLRKEADTPQDAIDEAFMHEIFETIKAKNNLVIDHAHLTVFSEVLFQVIKDNDLDFRR